jgi:hypothetical protein
MAVVLAGAIVASCGGSSPTSPSSTAITVTGTGATTLTYTTDVKPILDANCIGCHRPSQRDGGVDLSTYSSVLAVVIAGSDQSRLVRVTQPGGLMYGNLSGDRNAKAGTIYDWVVNSHAAQ